MVVDDGVGRTVPQLAGLQVALRPLHVERPVPGCMDCAVKHLSRDRFRLCLINNVNGYDTAEHSVQYNAEQIHSPRL